MRTKGYGEILRRNRDSTGDAASVKGPRELIRVQAETGKRLAALRRFVLVKKVSFVGLGKEGTKLAARIKLGKIAGGTPSVFLDWRARLLGMGRAEARGLGLPWNRVGDWKRTVRRTGTLRGDALRRLKRALIGSG